jgi:carbonic anhydrase/acetyltransferase-like protein (isoleucine patch superfamily)
VAGSDRRSSGVLGLVKPHHGVAPAIDPTAFVAEGAVVIGDVAVGPGSSVWYGSVLRGDVNFIRVGRESNIQDACVVHVHQKTLPCFIGDQVTVGHGVILHACTVKDRCLIGIGATVLDGAVIGPDAIVAAGSLVTPGTVIPPGTLVMGRPARPMRDLTPEDRDWILESAGNYVRYAAEAVAAALKGGGTR